jgi:hypothetical protein
MQLGQTYGIANVVVPAGGPKCVPINVDFTANGQVIIDGSLLVSQGKIEYLQGVFIDNSLNNNSVSLTMSTTNQKITCPSLAQGYFSIMVPDPPQLIGITQVGVIIPMFFYNVPIQPAVWKVA